MAFSIKTVADLWDHIGYVVLCAPDRFPHRDYLAENEQMTLERAFDQLRHGVEIACLGGALAEKRVWLLEALDRSLAAYRQGDSKGGAHILQDDFQDVIFKAN